MINKAEFFISSPSLNSCPEGERPEYAFIGRSNVGKSSLINALCNKKGLAKTSTKPGKTRLINYFLIDDNWFLVDLPGYGWAQVSKKEKTAWKKMTEEYLVKREQLKCVFLLIDSNIPPQKIDLAFIDWLGVNGIPFAIIFTKADKKNDKLVQFNLKSLKNELKNTWEELPLMMITSAKSKVGNKELINYILDINKR